MSASNTGSSGVKNLRAMFEKSNDQSVSPPSRGRSPNGSISSVSSRPLSKVRTSFVAVEKSGELGQASQLGLRKASDLDSIDDREENNMDSSEGPGLGLILKGSPFETTAPSNPGFPATAPTKSTPVPRTENKLADKPKVNGQPTSSTSANKSQTSDHKKLDGLKKEQASNTANVKSGKSLQTRVATKPASPTVAKKSPTGTTASPTQTQQTPTTPTRSSDAPMAMKLKGGPAKIKGVMESADKAKQERQAAVTKDVKPPSVASKPTAASKGRTSLAPKETTGDKVSAQAAAPTARSLKLPAAATATTAASAARKETPAQPDATKPVFTERKSTSTQAPRAATASTRASLARKTSRPSLANGNEKPKPRASNIGAQADEGFLARMTRPTASTSQKAHEKGAASTVQAEAKKAVGKAKEVLKKPSRRSINPARKSDEHKQEPPKVNGGGALFSADEQNDIGESTDDGMPSMDEVTGRTNAVETQTQSQQAEEVY